MIYSNQIITMICRALNLIDKRLVDHGVQVAVVMKDMLEADGIQEPELKRDLCILSLFHDVGAYQLEEIENLIQVETKSAWEHSIYGYLFLKEFAPFGELAETVLYHHADYNNYKGETKAVLHYAQLLHVADRVEIWHRGARKKDIDGLYAYLKDKSGTIFSKEAVECFLRADKQLDTYAKLDREIKFEEVVDCSTIKEEEIKAYLWMMVHAIDFRSRFTVTHTVGVVEIACLLAKQMGLSEKEQEQIYYGAILHDIGKIGTPVSILEKDGKLTDEEMEIMKEHVVLSGVIIKDCVEESVARIALRHHEKLNGMGYPLGLKAEELTLPERIMAVADIVSALSMSRSYKEAFPKEKVFAILGNMRDNGQLDNNVVEAMELGYDDMIKEADRVCTPLWEALERMGKEYKQLCENKNVCR